MEPDGITPARHLTPTWTTIAGLMLYVMTERPEQAADFSEGQLWHMSGAADDMAASIRMIAYHAQAAIREDGYDNSRNADLVRAHMEAVLTECKKYKL